MYSLIHSECLCLWIHIECDVVLNPYAENASNTGHTVTVDTYHSLGGLGYKRCNKQIPSLW